MPLRLTDAYHCAMIGQAMWRDAFSFGPVLPNDMVLCLPLSDAPAAPEVRKGWCGDIVFNEVDPDYYPTLIHCETGEELIRYEGPSP